MPEPPVVFFNIGWMREYKGLANDTIEGGGGFVGEHGYGHEMFNFAEEQDGWAYGFVQVNGAMSLERLGGNPANPAVEGVTVVWTATNPNEGGRWVVGWYRNATVYREHQGPLNGRTYNGHHFGFQAKAKVADVTLLPEHERTFRIPRGPGYFGHANVWYADSPEGMAVVNNVTAYIRDATTMPIGIDPVVKQILARQPDVVKRLKVEHAAVEAVKAYLTNHGYEITKDRQHEVPKPGWDFDAEKAGELLRLEVKGLSEVGAAELTPNEYRALRQHQTDYRICIVENALEDPVVHVCAYQNGIWRTQDSRTVEINEVVGATVYVQKDKAD